MKAEKIKKHMLRRTVVAASDEFDTTIGTIAGVDEGLARFRVEGVCTDQNAYERDFNWHDMPNIRKATDAERAEFFAWLVSDGRDIADGFARFGGVPRGFESRRAAQTSAADAPAPAFAVGQRVRIVRGGGDTCLRGFVNGDVCKVENPDTGGEHSVLVTAGLLLGYARPDQLEPVADAPAPAFAATPQHKVGDLRVGYSEYTGMADVGRVSVVDNDGDVHVGGRLWCGCCAYEPTPENVARLVEKQRERGIVPELGDLVFAMGRATDTMPGRVALVVRAGDEMALACAADVPLIGAGDLHVLVIRRNPLAELRNG